MLLFMGWKDPQEELTLNSKFSEKISMFRPNFVWYKGDMYIHYGMLIKCTCNTFRNASMCLCTIMRYQCWYIDMSEAIQ